MCFSATASFTVAGILTGVGAASMARNSSSSSRVFAAIPFMFAAQQAAEGFVWLTVSGTGHLWLLRLAIGAYLGFALIVWPMWFPFSLLLVERNHDRRRALAALLAVGAVVSLYACVLLMRWHPAASIAGHSLHYEYVESSDGLRELLYLLAYVVATVVPLFVSSTSLARTIGTTLAVSLLVATLVQRGALTSVWCFFAAVLSGMVFVAVGLEERLTAELHAARSAQVAE